MNYEFKSIVLAANVNHQLSEKHSEILNDYFKDGWEYVDSISQSISLSNHGKVYGSVIVVLKKQIPD